MAFSKTAYEELRCARQIAEFVAHPEDSLYYENLPIDQAAASCTIIEGLTTYAPTALEVYSPGTIYFLSKYMFLCKYLFLDSQKPMLDSQIMVIFNGIISATIALGRFAKAGAEEYVTRRKLGGDANTSTSEDNATSTNEDGNTATSGGGVKSNNNAVKTTTKNDGGNTKKSAEAVKHANRNHRIVRLYSDVDDQEVSVEWLMSTFIATANETELVDTALFFMNTLSVNHPKLQESTTDLQKQVGLGCLRFFNGYLQLALTYQKKYPISNIKEFYEPAKTVIQVRKNYDLIVCFPILILL